MSTTPAILTQDLAKQFGEKTVVRSVSLRVPRGEIYGFLGPNGAGKTTVIMMMLGLAQPTKGMVSLFGDASGAATSAVRCRIGALQEKPFIYPEMTAREYLRFFARLYGVNDPDSRIGMLLELVNLASVADRRLATFSRGMQQKACLARALVHDPDLLILDEPAAGLDPHGLKDLRELLCALRDQGKTIFLSSHHLSENEKICDRIGVMSEGVLVHEGTLEETVGLLERRPVYEVETTLHAAAQMEALTRLPFVARATYSGRTMEVELTDEFAGARECIASAIQEKGGAVLMVKQKRTSLESVFLEVTNKRVA